MKRISTLPVKMTDGKIVKSATGLLLNCNNEAPSGQVVLKLTLGEDASPKVYTGNSGVANYLVSNNELGVYSYVSVEYYEQHLVGFVSPKSACVVVEVNKLPTAKSVLAEWEV